MLMHLRRRGVSDAASTSSTNNYDIMQQHGNCSLNSVQTAYTDHGLIEAVTAVCISLQITRAEDFFLVSFFFLPQIISSLCVDP